MKTSSKKLIFAILSVVITLGAQILASVAGIFHLDATMHTVVAVIFAEAIYFILVKTFAEKKEQ